jgi:pyruvate/2-oxoacid:ferredoxin oxidoreductase beta subunit
MKETYILISLDSLNCLERVLKALRKALKHSTPATICTYKSCRKEENFKKKYLDVVYYTKCGIVQLFIKKSCF